MEKTFVCFVICLAVSITVVITVNYVTSLLKSDHIHTKIKYQILLIRSFHTTITTNNQTSLFSCLFSVEKTYMHKFNF